MCVTRGYETNLLALPPTCPRPPATYLTYKRHKGMLGEEEGEGRGSTVNWPPSTDLFQHVL